MDVLAIITARGGSKRLPGKNIKELCGKPLIAWTIEAAKNCARVVVTTDSDEIGEVSVKYGAEVIWRPDHLATDDAKSIDVVLDAIDTVGWEGRTMLLQPTSPLRTSVDIDNVWWLLEMTGAENVISIDDTNKETNGAIYLCKSGYWKEHKAFWGWNTALYSMPDERSVDIDTIEDFKLAEAYLNKLGLPK